MGLTCLGFQANAGSVTCRPESGNSELDEAKGTIEEPVHVAETDLETPVPIFVTLSLSDGRRTPAEARWAIVGEGSAGLIWRSNNETSSCMLGSTITYSPVSGYLSPPDVVVSNRPASDSLYIIGRYSLPPDAKATLTLDLSPTQVVALGAKWGFRSGTDVTWYESGVTRTNLTPGLYKITFAETSVTGWHKPDDCVAFLSGYTTVAISKAYSFDPVHISCEIQPSSALAAGAQWAVYDQAGLWHWMTNGTTYSGPPGSYKVMYKSIDGWPQPPETNFHLNMGDSISLTGHYERPEDYGVLQVWLSPSNPVPPGAGWRLDSFTNVYGHGDVLTNLSIGAHSISFCDVPGYFTPKPIGFHAAAGDRPSFSAVYQRCHQLNIRVALEGPLMTNQLMRALGLASLGHFPKSPYIADPRKVTIDPDPALALDLKIVDWVLIQLSAGTNSVPYFSRSAFLRHDGWVVDEKGQPGIQAQLRGATNWLVIQHRNHLAVMSASPLDAGVNAHTNDFTQSETAYRGGAAAAKQVQGLWCMVAGDTDGDGAITELDCTMTRSIRTLGVCRADVDMTLTATSLDSAFRSNNLGRVSHASCASETILASRLFLRAEQQTVLSLSTTRVVATSMPAGPTESEYYALIDNGFIVNSSSASTAVHGAHMAYVAGAGTGVDRVQFWLPTDTLCRFDFNVISPEMATNAGKAIVLAGTTGLN
ncbi:MAG TPA: hypothetical protein DCZ95_04975, partial [Verrucomicrobia bacterium]|nr:hypothetical protein [Verrucomicrobiota bacterium]